MSQQGNTSKKSDAEVYFEWYLDELERNNYIEGYDREPQQIIVIPPYIHEREKHFIKKENTIEEFRFIDSLDYTYDYRIIWSERALHIFTDIFNENEPFRFGQPPFVSHWMEIDGFQQIVSYVDVKPHFTAAQHGGNLSSFYTFPIIQKILMLLRGLYINKITPINNGKFGVNTCLFAKTFTPNRYLFTDKAQQKRKIRFKTVAFDIYVKRQQNIIEQYNKTEASKRGDIGQQSLL